MLLDPSSSATVRRHSGPEGPRAGQNLLAWSSPAHPAVLCTGIWPCTTLFSWLECGSGRAVASTKRRRSRAQWDTALALKARDQTAERAMNLTVQQPMNTMHAPRAWLRSRASCGWQDLPCASSWAMHVTLPDTIQGTGEARSATKMQVPLSSWPVPDKPRAPFDRLRRKARASKSVSVMGGLRGKRKIRTFSHWLEHQKLQPRVSLPTARRAISRQAGQPASQPAFQGLTLHKCYTLGRRRTHQAPVFATRTLIVRSLGPWGVGRGAMSSGSAWSPRAFSGPWDPQPFDFERARYSVACALVLPVFSPVCRLSPHGPLLKVAAHCSQEDENATEYDSRRQTK
ncbi:hypothetical protein ANO11243_021980 [Dothideomycetidae sp. 11243]|nr:hypothetical protein ANO11243_021980 [fungal sp. No.11243]